MVRIGKNGVRKDTDFKKKSSSHPVNIKKGMQISFLEENVKTLFIFYYEKNRLKNDIF